MSAPDSTIVRAAIHPSIGIARVGNSADGYLIGPEVNQPPVDPPGSYRDAVGKLKRQAARFRIYGLNAAGNVVAELTADIAEIAWSVHLANKKAAWFEFQLAQDIPEAASAPPQLLRNIWAHDRSSLAIDPGPRQISGTTVSGPGFAFDSGQFLGKPVYLGELRTDDQGRLIVLGGRGHAASARGTRAITFANNEGWHDDVSDGPVTAVVRYGGRILTVDPAWVVVAPPNYAPRRKSVRTMWDLMRDVAIKAGMLNTPARPSFTTDIGPIFERLSGLQWVNAGYAAMFGWRGAIDVGSPDHLLRLASNAADAGERRRAFANQFRVFARDGGSPVPWPPQYGDAMNWPPPKSPRQFAVLSDTQVAMLKLWAAGSFESDYDPAASPPRRIEDVAIADQPSMLDRAALEFCLADAFHPGCEMTWPMRLATMYAAPFRVQHAPPGWIEPEYGGAFSPDLLQLTNGPVNGQVPGGITRWMAVPWQTDSASCRCGYEPAYDPYLPTFWPARVPNHILPANQYEVIMDASRPMADRMTAFAERLSWLRPLLATTDYTDQINSLIADISQMGVVEQREGPGDPNFPQVMEVENLTDAVAQALAKAPHGQTRTDPTDLGSIGKVRRFRQ